MNETFAMSQAEAGVKTEAGVKGEFDPVAYINEPRWRESRLGLARVSALLDRMGRPQDRLKFVHVAGTNGKGSVCAYIESILRCAGYRTGLFTSPYIIRFEERIRVGGADISHDDLVRMTLFVRDHAEALAKEIGEHPTEFELMTAVAFEHFARASCDIVVCEVGLGGRLDSTNIIAAPEACVITRLGLDHTDLLGDTIEKIAREKAGIVKPDCTVVCWPQDDANAMRAIAEIAEARDAHVAIPDFSRLLARARVSGGFREFSYNGKPYRTRLLATYQPYNAALAIETIEVLRAKGWSVPQAAMESGLERAMWPGRFEAISFLDSTVVIDGAHNPQGARALAESLENVFPRQRVSFVVGVLADKDYRSMIREVASLAKSFVCVAPPVARALPAEKLAHAIREELRGSVKDDPDEVGYLNFERAQGESDADGEIVVKTADNFRDALMMARNLAGAEPICAFGSLYSISSLNEAMSR